MLKFSNNFKTKLRPKHIKRQKTNDYKRANKALFAFLTKTYFFFFSDQSNPFNKRKYKFLQNINFIKHPY